MLFAKTVDQSNTDLDTRLGCIITDPASWQTSARKDEKRYHSARNIGLQLGRARLPLQEAINSAPQSIRLQPFQLPTAPPGQG